jgi:hypothetical protein
MALRSGVADDGLKRKLMEAWDLDKGCRCVALGGGG